MPSEYFLSDAQPGKPMRRRVAGNAAQRPGISGPGIPGVGTQIGSAPLQPAASGGVMNPGGPQSGGVSPQPTSVLAALAAQSGMPVKAIPSSPVAPVLPQALFPEMTKFLQDTADRSTLRALAAQPVGIPGVSEQQGPTQGVSRIRKPPRVTKILKPEELVISTGPMRSVTRRQPLPDVQVVWDR